MIRRGGHYAWGPPDGPVHQVPLAVIRGNGEYDGTAVCGVRLWVWGGWADDVPAGRARCGNCFRNREETGE